MICIDHHQPDKVTIRINIHNRGYITSWANWEELQYFKKLILDLDNIKLK